MPPSIPVATYRLQFTRDFGFDDAAALVPYLQQLGISHLYASPFLAARAGSTHGYDIVDHARLNPELGGDDAFERLSSALRAAEMGLILDFVPNHMGVGFADNAWWLDVLEWGQKSPHAASFDIDWQGLPYRTQPGVLLPILGRPYGDALAQGEIELKYDAATGTFAAWYFEHKLPINPQRYGEVLRTLVAAANAHDTAAGQAMIALAQRHRNPRAPSYQQAPAFKRDLAAIDGVADIISRGLYTYRSNTDAGPLALHRLLERQNYQLAFWRVAFSAINYRRFFDINDLAGLRAEHPATFRAIHGLVARLIAEEKLHGLRLDHIDGLHDPAQYARRLQEAIRRVQPMPRGRSFYVLVEKILGEDEQMPKLAGVAGTTGYERLNLILHSLLDADGLPSLEHTWRDFTGESRSFDDLLRAAKQRVLGSMLASEFTVLSRVLARIAAGHFSTRDFASERLRAALEAYVLAFPVYRTYIATSGPSQQDRDLIDRVIAQARKSWQGPDPDIFDFLRAVITTDLADDTGYSAPRVRNFAMKLQQFTGPLMAKSLEDTTFYRYHRLIALNEVGGDPHAPAASLDHFHQAQQALAQTALHGLTATATHDTKRGEDARMRILALAEIPNEWQSAVARWAAHNTKFVRSENGSRLPSAPHEYMLYQALIGAWPLTPIDESFVKRMQAYALKAAREGKLETSWTNPDERYEASLNQFISDILDRTKSTDFVQDFTRFAERTALLGALNSLSQLTLKALLPGVPDFFQGTEYWDTSLVDPDNRRPVDYNMRRRLISENSAWPDLTARWRDGTIKFALTRKLLHIRNTHKDVLRDGSYQPFHLSGRHANHVIGFSRTHRKDKLLILAGRHFAGLVGADGQWPQGWDGHIDRPGQFYDLLRDKTLTPEELHLNRLFSELPVAVLRADASSPV